MIIQLRYRSSIAATTEVLTPTIILLLTNKSQQFRQNTAALRKQASCPDTLRQSSPSCLTLCGILPALFGGGHEGHKVHTETSKIHTEFFKLRPTNCRSDVQK
jgi:hypothetical protein